MGPWAITLRYHCPRLDVQAPEAIITSRQDAALEMINVNITGNCVKYVFFS